jgi:alanyl aminopeptidase
MFSSGLGNLRQDLEFAETFSRNPDSGLVRQSAEMIQGVASFVPKDLRSQYAAWIRSLYRSRAHQLGWEPKENESPAIRSLRIEILPLVAMRGDDAQLQAQARNLAHKWLKDRSAINSDMVVPVLSAAAWSGDRTFFDELVTALKETKAVRERLWIADALGSFRDPTLARATLNLLFANDVDPRELQRNLFGAPSETRPIVWSFVEQNFGRLNSRLPGARGIPFGAMLPLSASGFCDAQHREQIAAFFQPRIGSLPGGARNLANTLESIRLCTARAELEKPAISAFLRKQ